MSFSMAVISVMSAGFLVGGVLAGTGRVAALPAAVGRWLFTVAGLAVVLVVDIAIQRGGAGGAGMHTAFWLALVVVMVAACRIVGRSSAG